MHAGVDGCSGGWIVVHRGRASVVGTFAAVLAALPPETVVGVDIPIGLLEVTVPGGRRCDRLARRALRGTRTSSVFSAPPRPTLGLGSLREVQDAGFRMTLQTLNIAAKVADVDAVMDPALRKRVHEVHPELAFVAMGDGEPPAHSKRLAAGRAERLHLLRRHGVAVPDLPRGAAVDDLLDACAAGWSAHRIATGRAERVPDEPDLDARGLRMEIAW